MKRILQGISIVLVATGISAVATAQTHVDGKFKPAPHLVPFGLEKVPAKNPAAGPMLAPGQFCSGEQISSACPCRNVGAPGHGCENSAYTGGALLTMSGESNLASDSVQFLVQGAVSDALSIVVQGDASVRPAVFGDGVRCIGGELKRLYVQAAGAGRIFVPMPRDESVSARSIALGDPIPNGGVRYYQVFYRDPAVRFCESPAGDMFNASNGVSITWVR